MSEPDHLYLRPMPLLATEKKAAAFPFFYINPKAGYVQSLAHLPLFSSFERPI